MYARFLGVALGINRKENKWSVRFLRSVPYTISAYILLLKMALDNQNQSLVFILMGIIRTYFLVLGLYLLIMTLRKKKSTYYYLIGSGAVVLIIFAIISTLVEFYFLNGHSVMIRGLSWLLIGFFIEVIFYSAAVGYRTKKENIQRVDALQKIVDQYDIIKQHDIDKLKAMYQSKEEERNRIVKDIHDEIGSTVSSIYILSNVAIQDKDKKDNSPMLIEIRDNAATLSDKVDDIVWSMNPQHDYMESLLNRIRQFATPLFEAKEIDYDFRFDKELLYKKTEAQSRQYIYYIVKEAINNLIKYSDCKKAIVIAKHCQSGYEFEVIDDGKGIEHSQDNIGNGLHFMKQRATSIGAELSIESETGKGTTISLFIKNQING